MDGIQITEPKKLNTITKKETYDDLTSAKVVIYKTMLVREDFNTFLGDDKVDYPIIPARIGIGRITQVKDEVENICERGMRVIPHPEVACEQCYECFNGNFKDCVSFKIAGKNTDGFLRDFVVCKRDNMSLIPPQVNDYSALFIDHVALCVNVIDQLALSKGEHVIIVGSNALGIFLAQLVIYYQGIPIIIDHNEKNLEYAKRAGVYFTLFADNKLEKNVSDLTGARLTKKVVYMTSSNLNTDIALKLASPHATVCFAGFGTPSIRVNFNTALSKQLDFKCVTTGYKSIDSAINLLANGAVTPSIFNVPAVKQVQAMDKIKEMAKDITYDAESGMLIVDII